jgi:hypothetical protein
MGAPAGVQLAGNLKRASDGRHQAFPTPHFRAWFWSHEIETIHETEHWDIVTRSSGRRQDSNAERPRDNASKDISTKDKTARLEVVLIRWIEQGLTMLLQRKTAVSDAPFGCRALLLMLCCPLLLLMLSLVISAR